MSNFEETMNWASEKIREQAREIGQLTKERDELVGAYLELWNSDGGEEFSEEDIERLGDIAAKHKGEL
jgi:hypothetical protein